MNEELLSKDECMILRGIAILTVILSHTSGIFLLFDGIPIIENRITCIAIGKAGMPMFLLISGYGLQMSYLKHGLKNYWKKRLIAVFIPYVIIQSFSMIVDIIIHGSEYSFFYNISVLFGINASNSYDSTMWYISYILFWYLVFYISYKLWHGSLMSLLIIASISLAGFFYVPFYWGNNADYCILSFFIGVLVAWLTTDSRKNHIENKEDMSTDCNSIYVESHDQSTKNKRTIIFQAFAAVLLAILGYTLLIRFYRLNIITDNLGSLAAGAAFIILVKLLHNKYAFPVLTFIGSISFPLYLLEWKLIINNKLYDITGVNYLTYGICFALTLVLSFLFNKAYSYISKEISSQIRNKRSI